MHVVHLTKGQVAVVDDADADEVSRFTWSAFWCAKAKRYYASRREGERTILLHRHLLGVTDPAVQVDHRNHDGLDNSRSNLRLCTNRQNQQNQRKRSGTSSRFKGVFRFRSGKWAAQISSGALRSDGSRKRVHLGYFLDEEDAARAYDAAARREFGEFARLNFSEAP